MTQFILIDPENKNIRLAEAPSWRDAALTIDLPSDECDHQSLGREYGMFVYEWGLVKPRKTGLYWRLDKLLLNGPAVIYREIEGKPADCPSALAAVYDYVEFLGSEADVEAAIVAGRVNRPQTKINGKVVWEWNKGEKQ